MKTLILLVTLTACSTPIYRHNPNECDSKGRVKLYKPTPGERRGN